MSVGSMVAFSGVVVASLLQRAMPLPIALLGGAVRKGMMAATGAQFASRMGSTAVDNAVKLLKGQTIPAFTPVPIELVK